VELKKETGQSAEVVVRADFIGKGEKTSYVSFEAKGGGENRGRKKKPGRGCRENSRLFASVICGRE